MIRTASSQFPQPRLVGRMQSNIKYCSSKDAQMCIRSKKAMVQWMYKLANMGTEQENDSVMLVTTPEMTRTCSQLIIQQALHLKGAQPFRIVFLYVPKEKHGCNLPQELLQFLFMNRTHTNSTYIIGKCFLRSISYKCTSNILF